MKLKPEDVNRILELKEKGVSIKEIAKLFNVTPRRIYQILKERRISKPGRPKKELSEQLIKEIVEYYERGYSIQRIKMELNRKGISISTYLIWKTLRERGYTQKRKDNDVISIISSIKKLLGQYDDVYYVDVITVYCKDNRLKILFIVDLKARRLIHLEIKSTIRLTDVIAVLDKMIKLKYSNQSTLLLIHRTPPLVPTKGKSNKLTKFLNRRHVEYKWITYPQYISNLKQEMLKIFKDMKQEEVEYEIKLKFKDLGSDVCQNLRGDLSEDSYKN